MNHSDKVFFNPIQTVADAQIIFVADAFVEQYGGGAELTTEALIKESPYKIQKILSADVNLSTLMQGADKFWIFGNFSQLNAELIPSIIGNLKYAVLEYDYKFCKYRSPEKHASASGSPCDCHEDMTGKMISAFYYRATSLWWMSEKQKERYMTMFPFLREKDNIVLSSVFDKETLGTLRLFSAARQKFISSGNELGKWLIFSSHSWIKGTAQAIKWCVDNNKDYELVGNLSYKQFLEKLSLATGLIYLPPGADTCPRMIIEAKLLGCDLIINSNVQHKDEEWFTGSIDSIYDYLFTVPSVFWNGIRHIMEYKPKISGYLTTYNCINQHYPYIQSIKSMLTFCDEVCIVDGGSTDKTWDKLVDLAYPDAEQKLSYAEHIALIEDLRAIGCSPHQSKLEKTKVKLQFIKRDWSHPRHAVFDGMQKAAARLMCTSEFCWQMDSDEIVHEDDANKILSLCSKLPKDVTILALPVVEYWGGQEKIRIDIQPWKWRLSRNLPYITHGIPRDLRRSDENGLLYASEGTDGCDMIHNETFERLPHITFHTEETENLRRAAITGASSTEDYQAWFNAAIEQLPGVYHYSWFDMTRKIRLYRDYWTKHWNSLHNKSQADTAESNMMFDLPWSQVSEDMISDLAKKLKAETGGWIWHSKWKGQRIPHMSIRKTQPAIML